MAQYLLDPDRPPRIPLVSERSRHLSGSASASRLTTNAPGARIVPVVSRSESYREAHPDQLSLDGRDLLACPMLENEHALKILSLQNNYIRSIERLSLQNLILLDFYNNNIQNLSGLELVPNLRVLLLGKNGIRTIQNLQRLSQLVVLDLLANNINRIENIQYLKTLRVLNLEHNRIERIAKLSGLSELVEVNLAHNQVAQISPLRGVPNLRRMFLSHNRIDSVMAIEEICSLRSLIELTLKWNPITADLQLVDRLTSSLPTLTGFDLWKEGVRPSAPPPAEIWPEVRLGAATEGRRPDPEAVVAEGLRTHDNSAGFHETKTVAPWPVTLQKIQLWWERIKHRPDGLDSGNSVPSYYKLEDARTKLVIFGFGFQALELEQSMTCACVSFNYVPFSTIVPFFSKLITWPNLKRLEFHYNALATLRQLDALAVCMKIEDLTLSNNPIVEIAIHRPYLLFTMKNLRRYNGTVVSADDALAARARFRKRWPKCSKTALRTKTFLTVSIQSIMRPETEPACCGPSRWR